jgi:proteasome lid subunit RPN8/RPN11
MSRIDVRDLASEKLPPGKFPIEARADFRLFISPEVRRGIDEHAKADVSVEICGVLVGNWGVDENGPFAAVTDYIRCANAASKFAEVTFTHESWAQINKEMDSRFADSRIVGWYHSHPDFGIFLSERDTFIQQHFFSGPGQVAYVVDPVRDLEGVFAWRDGKPQPLPHYWVGDRVRTVESSERNPAASAQSADKSGAGSAGYDASRSWDSMPLGLATLVLGALTMLLAGYLYGSWRARAEESINRQEAVARFADLDMIRIGLEGELESVRKRLATISDSLKRIPPPGEKLTDEQLKESSVRLAAIEHHLKLSDEDIRRASALTDAERAIYSRIIVLKMDELRRMVELANAMQQQRRTDAKKSAPASKGATAQPKAKPAESAPSADKGEKQPALPSPQQPPDAKSAESAK